MKKNFDSLYENLRGTYRLHEIDLEANEMLETIIPRLAADDIIVF